ncbi:uncharacterized protein LOC118746600 [Rhagoletis pomonella]|uniref:uncharacterized protein LOC118746600 n=1 Tax=Rhagoletis pomonella TaxID=28610 RepID=UPI0017821AC1|nr:uncharacterized protein LOC118746600 [Rhagoletis pomonella]
MDSDASASEKGEPNQELDTNPASDWFEFADDLALISTGTNRFSAALNLQNKIEELQAKCDSLNLKFNPNKTKFMYMSANNKQTFSVSINGLNIEQVHHFKWLGRTISANSTIKRLYDPKQNMPTPVMQMPLKGITSSYKPI